MGLKVYGRTDQSAVFCPKDQMTYLIALCDELLQVVKLTSNFWTSMVRSCGAPIFRINNYGTVECKNRAQLFKTNNAIS